MLELGFPAEGEAKAQSIRVSQQGAENAQVGLTQISNDFSIACGLRSEDLSFFLPDEQEQRGMVSRCLPILDRGWKVPRHSKVRKFHFATRIQEKLRSGARALRG